MRRNGLPTISAWHSRAGLVEEYEYPPGWAETGRVHVHRELQICFSVDFPGRYLYRGARHDVPVGAISVVDSWEPHAASDPCDRDRASHYLVVYVDPVLFRASVDQPPGAAIEAPVRTDVSVVRRFLALYGALSSDESVLEQDERYRELASLTIGTDAGRAAPAPATRSLLRARDFIAAHAVERITLEQAAAQADLSPWHFTRAFRKHFGAPPHRFQMWMRIDVSRRLLAEGLAGAEVAHVTGFADQSHFTRWFKRLVRTTPERYRKHARRRLYPVGEPGRAMTSTDSLGAVSR